MTRSRIGRRVGSAYCLLYDENKHIVGVAIRREQYVVVKIRVLAYEGQSEFQLDEVPADVYRACKEIFVTQGQGEFITKCVRRRMFHYGA